MNEQAVEHAYNLFQADGYEDSIDDFQSLLQTNGDAVSHAYNLFKNDGYQDTMEDFETLLGLKKTKQNKKKVLQFWEMVHQMWKMGLWCLENQKKLKKDQAKYLMN